MRTIFFDLDGTLADTAPDLKLALDTLRRPQGLEPIPIEQVRTATALGTDALLALGWAKNSSHADYEALRTAFLDQYERLIGTATVAFEGVTDTLAHLTAQGLKWGVVTNKHETLARGVLRSLGILDQAACLVFGDTVIHRKPHPEPLLLACRLAGVLPHTCVYVGDDHNDIKAAHAAGMPGLAVAYGYGTATEIHTWNADAILPTLPALLWWLNTQDALGPA